MINEYEIKYDMTREENIEYAKRNIIDYIYKSAKLEGLGVTYPDTDSIYHGLLPTGGSATVKDVLTINNLKHAWEFLLDTLDVPTDYAFVCKINQIVGEGNLIMNAGYIRKMDVNIGGTSWKPTIPIESQVKEKLLALEEINNPINKAIATTLWLMRSQLFFDGNKRTSMLVGNKILIENGAGIISVPVENQQEFKEKLLVFYESNKDEDIANFLYEKSIDGANFTLDRHHENDKSIIDKVKTISDERRKKSNQKKTDFER